MNKKLLHVGTSGWHYKHWKGPFYPDDLKTPDYLKFYGERFHAAEINQSFYGLPERKTMKEWCDQTPARFIFATKASRYITHMKKLKDPNEPVKRLLNRVEALEDKAGPVLFQLPPRWKANPERLESFLKALPKTWRYAFEFRDSSWFSDEIYTILSEYGAAFCIYDLDRQESPHAVTADFVYVRLHGPDGAYQGKYDKKSLSKWKDAFSEWSDQKKDVYCYFDNDENGYAVQNAFDLANMISGDP